MGASILVLIYRIIVIFIGVSLLVYRQMVRYNSENITLQVVEAKKVWTSPTSWGIYRFFVTYEYNGVVYRQKSIEFGVFLFSFKNKTIYNCTGKRSIIIPGRSRLQHYAHPGVGKNHEIQHHSSQWQYSRAQPHDYCYCCCFLV